MQLLLPPLLENVASWQLQIAEILKVLLPVYLDAGTSSQERFTNISVFMRSNKLMEALVVEIRMRRTTLAAFLAAFSVWVQDLKTDLAALGPTNSSSEHRSEPEPEGRSREDVVDAEEPKLSRAGGGPRRVGQKQEQFGKKKTPAFLRQRPDGGDGCSSWLGLQNHYSVLKTDLIRQGLDSHGKSCPEMKAHYSSMCLVNLYTNYLHLAEFFSERSATAVLPVMKEQYLSLRERDFILAFGEQDLLHPAVRPVAPGPVSTRPRVASLLKDDVDQSGQAASLANTLDSIHRDALSLAGMIDRLRFAHALFEWEPLRLGFIKKTLFRLVHDLELVLRGRDAGSAGMLLRLIICGCGVDVEHMIFIRSHNHC